MTRAKLISLLLVLSMVFSMMVFPVAAVEEGTETPDASTESNETTEATEPAAPFVCPLHPDAVWVEIGEDSWNAGQVQPGETGHYRLTGTQTPSKALTIKGSTQVCIDLNGHNITGPNSNGVRVLEIEAGSTLTILDSVGTGVISGGKNVASGGASGAHATAFGGNIQNAGTLNLYGGTISGGMAYDGGVYRDSRGGNYYGTETSVLNMYGGTITGGKAYTTSYTLNEDHWGGGANIYSLGTVNIHGGTIRDGKSEATDTSGSAKRAMMFFGGNIAVVGGTLNITGGTITNGQVLPGRTSTNYATYVYAYGGNIYAKNTAVSISGGEITNGYSRAMAKTTGTASNAFLTAVRSYGGNIYVAGGSFEMSAGSVTGGKSEIQVVNQGVQDKDKEEFAFVRGANLYLYSVTATISGGLISGGYANEIVDDDDTTLDGYGTCHGGNAYLDTSVTLNLSGGKMTDSFAHYSGGNLFNGGTVNMTGGEISGGATVWNVNGTGTGGNVQNGGTFNMSGGVISDGAAYYRGGNIYNAKTFVMSGDAVVTGGTLHEYEKYTAAYGGNYYGTGILKMYDNAVLKDGSAYNGGNICTATSNGDIYMYGGMIYGGTCQKYGDNVRIYGDDGCSLRMYGGYMETLNDGGTTNVIELYNGIFKGDVSKTTTTDGATSLMSCAHYTVLANGYYNVWHAEGACAACGHTYESYAVGTSYASTDTNHLTLGGTHTFVDGACSVCGYVLPEHNAVCSHGCENVTWTAFDGVTLENGGHYYLADNMVLTDAPTMAGIHVCLDLNGYTLTAAPAERAFLVDAGGELVLMDSSSANTGLLRSFSLPVTSSGGNLYAKSGSKIYLYDLTVSDGVTSNERGGNIYLVGTGTLLEVNNAKIRNGRLVGDDTRRGGNICAYQRANVVIKGADTRILDGVAYGTGSTCYGGNIHFGQGGTLYIYDGLISGGVAENGANISLVNGKEEDNQKGYMYMYGGTIGGNGYYADGKQCGANSIRISQSTSNSSDMYMYGGNIEGTFSADGAVGKVVVYGGTLKRTPLTMDNGKNALAECACFSYDAQTGTYTVGHLNGETTCNLCAPNDMGAANGYSAAYVYTNQATHTYTDACVCDNCQVVTAKLGETEYTDLTAALAAAGAENVVALLKDAYVAGDVDIYTTLDLNGKALTVSGIISAENSDAAIIDGVGTGTATGAEVIMNPANGGILSIDEKNDGVHIYEKVELVQKLVQTETDASIKFYIDKNAEATKLDDAILAGSDVKIRITVKWGADKSHSFVYTDDLVQQYLADWNNKIFTCQIAGLDMLGECTITADVMSNGVVVAAYEFGSK